MKPLTMSDRELTWLRDAFPRTTSNGGLLLAEVDACHAEIERLKEELMRTEAREAEAVSEIERLADADDRRGLEITRLLAQVTEEIKARLSADAENARLAEQLLQDGPLAASARAYQAAHDAACLVHEESEPAWIVAHDTRIALLDLARAQPVSAMSAEPIQILLWCPYCGARHVDEGEWATRVHHTHACQNCGMVWRPAVVATVGVRFLPGFKNAVDQRDAAIALLRRLVVSIRLGSIDEAAVREAGTLVGEDVDR